MREIKFRAWVGGQYMIDSGYGDWISFDGVPYTEAPPHDTPNIEITKAQDYIVMQFTGLLDKNEKEIYESDIIKIEHPHKSRTFDGPVEWLDYGWGCRDFHFSHFDSPVDIFSEGTEYIEVIGNIYQNKDLLG